MAAIATRSVNEVHGNSNMSSSKDLSNDSTNNNAASAKQQGDNVKSEDSKEQNNKNSSGSTANAQPLAPPPKPNQSGQTETPDYFSGGHNNSHFSLEPNPFEQSFGNPSTDTPGKFAGLPSVASLTSPAPIGPGGTPSWQNSLRSGPLSPAMLPGPTPSNGYFDESFRGSFPTPNESSLRTGLTPGGGGSMFPAPSPGSQAIYNSLQSGGATPGTLDFHRSAMNAAARTKSESTTNNTSNNNNSNSNNNTNATSGTNSTTMGATPAGINKSDYQPAQQHPQSNPFANPSDSDAASSLFMLANNVNRNNQFAVPNQPQSGNNSQAQNSSPTAQRAKQSIGSMTGSADYDGSDGNDGKGSAARRKGGKKGKAGQASNGRRKAEDTPAKQPASKKARSNSTPNDMSNDDHDDDDSDMEDDDDETNAKSEGGGGPNSNKKMTDEEKRKNFLERNRVAALKCRQRKKQWLQNLQTKVEIFSTENEALNATCAQLRDEIHNLKTLLMAHKDCAVSHSQGLGGNAMAQVLGGGDFNQHGGGGGGAGGGGYGMMSGGGQMMQMQAGQGMQRR